MTAHSPHPDSHTHGLADDCPRCQEHAEHPARSLDRDNIKRLLTRGGIGRTDQIAAARLQDALEMGRYLIKILDGTARERALARLAEAIVREEEAT